MQVGTGYHYRNLMQQYEMKREQKVLNATTLGLSLIS